MGPRVGLDWWKISYPPGFDPEPSVTIPTELPGLHNKILNCINIKVIKNIWNILTQNQL